MVSEGRCTLQLWLVTVTCLLVCDPVRCLLEEERKATFLTAAVGEAVVFNCQLDFPHDIEIPYVLQWNKDGQTVFSSYDGDLSASESYKGRVKQLPHDSPYGKGSINLTSIRESDAGWYECRVFFPNRSPTTRHNGTWFHLSVDGGNLLIIPPINQTILEGAAAQFACVIKDNESSVMWFKDGVPITELTELTLRASISPEGSLTISPTSMEDFGEYMCEVTNTDGEKQTVSAFLNVQYKAKVVYSPREIYLPYGRPGLLDCHFRANPPLTNLRWEKDGFLFDPYNVQGVFYRRNGSLYFSNIDETHAGSYQCTPFNELGTEGPSPKMKVTVQRPPVFTITPNNLYLKKRGDTVEMPCDALDGDGKHKTNIAWFKDATPLPHGRTKIQNGNLTIYNVEEDDRGIYQCTASNEAATISVESELMIENIAPRAPYNVTASSTADTITTSWFSGYGRSNMDFSVWYRVVDENIWISLPILPRSVTETTIKNLSPAKEYEVMVLSKDKYGDGMFSKSLRVKTKGIPEIISSAQKFLGNTIERDTETGPPRNINVEMLSAGYLVSWTPPYVGEENLLQYSLIWSRGTHVIGRVETTDTEYLVTDLEEDESYIFQVVSVSKAGVSTEGTKFLVHVPSYRKVRAVSLGIGLGLILLVILLLAVWCGRRVYVNRHVSNSSKEDRLSIST